MLGLQAEGWEMTPQIALAATLLLGMVGVAGDYFLKLASQREPMFLSVSFAAGFGLYSLTAFGWVIVLKSLKLATVGVVYSVATVLLLALIGRFVFNERLSSSEIVGVLLGVASVVLLARNA